MTAETSASAQASKRAVVGSTSVVQPAISAIVKDAGHGSMSSEVLSDDTDASGHGAWSKASSRKRRKKTLSQYEEVGQVANNSIMHNVSNLQNRRSRLNNSGGAAQKGQKKVIIGVYRQILC